LVIGIKADALEATDVARTATPGKAGGGWAARLSTRLRARPKRFQAKWVLVRVKKTRQNKEFYNWVVSA
jgi:hypothetical protein